MSKLVRTTKHCIKFSNVGKLDVYQEFVREARNTMQQYLDYLWNNPIYWDTENKQKNITHHVMDIANNKLEHPSMLSNVDLEKNIVGFHTELSARTCKCILTQILGIIGASLEKQRKRLYMYNKKVNDGDTISSSFQKKLEDNVPVKPYIGNVNIELNSLCCDFEFTTGEFNGFIQLKCLYKDRNRNKKKIRIPLKFHRNNKKYQSWDMMTSFLFSDRNVDIRWEKEKPAKKTTGIKVGSDQGLKDILTLSDKQVTPKFDKHGYSMEKILDKMSRQKLGSKAFKKSVSHRQNFVKWSINQLNFSNIGSLGVEKIWNIGYKSGRSRYLGHWTNTIIRDKVIDTCELLGVQVVIQDSTYRSQRCSVCGLVRKSNRKGKLFKCKNCGIELDSDYNASMNHEIDLPEIFFDFRKLRKNLKGFFWKPEGIFDLNGVEFTVPLVPKT